MKTWKMNKAAFYILSYTWGILLTVVGWLVAGVLMSLGYKPKKWGGSRYFVVGKNWGGLSIGTTIVVSDSCTDDFSLNHEFGHSVQNCYFGPFCLFLVTIPSFVRACWREFVFWAKIKKRSELSDYYSIWFERTASELGEANVSKF